jgi:hypothetical protein
MPILWYRKIDLIALELNTSGSHLYSAGARRPLPSFGVMKAERSVSMTDRHKPNMPGGYYLSPGNQELAQLSLRLPPPVIAKFRDTANAAGLSQREAAELAIDILARELQPKARHTPKRRPTPKTPGR